MQLEGQWSGHDQPSSETLMWLHYADQSLRLPILLFWGPNQKSFYPIIDWSVTHVSGEIWWWGKVYSYMFEIYSTYRRLYFFLNYIGYWCCFVYMLYQNSSLDYCRTDASNKISLNYFFGRNKLFNLIVCVVFQCTFGQIRSECLNNDRYVLNV